MLVPASYPNYVFGMDSSVWDDINETPKRPDFQRAYDRGCRFNYHRASFGMSKDTDYDVNWENARKTKMLVGSYHFLVWTGSSPEQQAEFYWNIVKNDPGELPLICDFEWWSVIPSNAFDLLYRFLEKMKTLCGDRKLGIYTAYSFWKEHGRMSDYWKQYVLWLARYMNTPPIGPTMVPAPWDKCDFWQFSGHGDGLYYGMESKDVDLNFYMGSWEELQKLCNVKIGDIEEKEEINMTDYSKYAIGLSTKTVNQSQKFDFVIGYAGSSWNEPNQLLKPIEAKALEYGSVFGAMWDFDVDWYAYKQLKALDANWPPVASDLPLQKCIEAIKARDIKFMVVRVMTYKSLSTGITEAPEYISYAAHKFMERLHTWLKANKPGINWDKRLILDTEWNWTVAHAEPMKEWMGNYPSMVEQKAILPLLNSYPQTTDKIKNYLSNRPTCEFWNYYDSANVDLVLFYLGDKTAWANWVGVIAPPPPPPIDDDPDVPPVVDPKIDMSLYVKKVDFDALVARVEKMESFYSKVKSIFTE